MEREINQDLIDSLRLSLVADVGPITRRALLDRFGTPAAVFAAAPDEIRAVKGVGPKLLSRILAARHEVDPQREIDLCREHDIQILTDTDPGYPRALAEIHDPPSTLFVRGRILPSDATAVAIVGTRHATSYGLRQAERLAGSLARAGVTVVSGLARGVDGAAHRGALAAGGRTIAVLGSGLLRIFPPEHVGLADEIAAAGAVVSELPPEFEPMGGNFPQRNRIISGLSLGTLIVEAPERSGALITARLAMEQGRDVFAVPGPVDSRPSRGCHRLLRDGATLVESADDVLEHLGFLVEPAAQEDGTEIHHPAELMLTDVERQVLNAIDREATSIDELVCKTQLTVPQVLSTVSVLEMRRLVRRVSGSKVARN
ncbi:MAG TPA: DNA-processing protein DprA [Thermoguttaceae bacterium]|nr:DNA-processing protein DprA [Thermoguttaceae bacterium]